MFNVPGTTDEWFDESANSTLSVEDLAVKPLFLAAFTSDRGPTGLRKVNGTDFFKLYGKDCSFEKHGQPLLQAASQISAGAELLCARVVASDATLANLTVIAEVSVIQTQKTRADGQLLYIDKTTQSEVVDATNSEGTPNDPAMINTASIKYSTITMENVKSYDDVKTELANYVDEDTTNLVYKYPIFTVVDNGAGLSTKRFKISPNYTLSRNLGFMLYQFIYDGSLDFDYEYTNFSTVIGKVYNNSSMALSMSTTKMLQLKAYEYEAGLESLYNTLANITGTDLSVIETYDILTGKNLKGKALTEISIDTTGYDLSADIGFGLASGSNGSFNDAPILSGSYDAAITSVFDGSLTDDIYDLDRYQIDACFDAAYPLAAKKKIVELADFRHDFMYFGDLGNEDITSYDTLAALMPQVTKSKFAAYYFQYGSVIDPFSKKFITVTLPYAISTIAATHFVSRANAAFCGIANGFTFPEFIEGTINFLPKKTLLVDQKSMVQELHVNYASILRDVLTLETTFTSQEAETQLSYINNVTSIQEVIKDIRYNCPSIRYTFVTEDDVDEYQTALTNICKKYEDNFDLLEPVFTQDEIMKANKLFEVSLRFKHKQFYTAEKIKVYTLGISA